MSLALEIVKVPDAHPMWIGVKTMDMLSDGRKAYVRESEWPALKDRLDSIATLRTMGFRVNVPDDAPPVLENLDGPDQPVA